MVSMAFFVGFGGISFGDKKSDLLVGLRNNDGVGGVVLIEFLACCCLRKAPVRLELI